VSVAAAKPFLLLVATLALVLTLILTAVGLQVDGAAEQLLLELRPVNDVASNGHIIVAPAFAPANCLASSDEWKVDVSMPEQFTTIKRVEAFMRFQPGPPPVDNTISARLDGGLLSVNAPPESAFLTWTSISEDHGDGAWIAFDFPDFDAGDANVIAFMIRSRAGHESSAWDTTDDDQGGLRAYCAGTSDTAWVPASTQLAVRVYGSLHGSSTGGGGGGLDIFTRISPIFFATAAFLYAIALVPGKHLGLTFIEAVIIAVAAFFAWTYAADAIQAALGGGP